MGERGPMRHLMAPPPWELVSPDPNTAGRGRGVNSEVTSTRGGALYRSKDQLQHKLNAAWAAVIKKRAEESAARFIGHLFGQAKVMACGQQVVSGGRWC